MSLQEALSNTRSDGIGALYREGTASLLNSMVNKNFPFTTSHVRDSFVAALSSNNAAAAQASHPLLLSSTHLPQHHDRAHPLPHGQELRLLLRLRQGTHSHHLQLSLISWGAHARNFWRNHLHLLSDLLGWWRNTIGRSMGLGNIPGFHSTMSLQEALSNTRSDGIGALYREGTASLLNSMVNKNFPFTTSHVRDSFVAALSSNNAAAAQAEVFKLANEGRLKPRF
ncbi:hypothetical protein CTI12_AA532200 [Artemisia annua]|uniref:Uncharacterized protein n=1 Tax=Artemisia annua TaxID=35608 RepID=A0A2U1L497_ARTAN|nr:hypothetical protein CTI12_AA532200 [Artemisia annua]